MSHALTGAKQGSPARTKRLSWTAATRVFRDAAPPLRPREICGIVDAPASLTRIRKGIRGRVRLLVKPEQLEAALNAVVEGT
jgi:hypothetical protein